MRVLIKNDGLSHFNIKIAGLVYEIYALYSSTRLFLNDYITNETSPDIRIVVTEKDIQREMEEGTVYFYTYRQIDGKERKLEIYKEINENRIETVTIYRKIVEASLAYGVFLIHGAVIAVNNASYMFIAPSGTGKTTHIKQWLNRVHGAFVVNDSKVIACGTPWCGNEGYGINTMVPLKSIIIMERSDDNSIEEISFGQAYPSLLQQVYLPDDAKKARMELDLISQLFGKVRFFKFRFNNFKDDCFDVAYNALVGKQQ